MKAAPEYLLVGEAPPPGTITTPYHRQFATRLVCRALDVEAARRVAKEINWGALRDSRRLLTRFASSCEHVNLLKRWPGYDRRGSAFPLIGAQRRARLIHESPSPHRARILAGRRVAAAFNLYDFDYFEALDVDGHDYVVVPHPSGVNRWWNDPGNRSRARVFFESLGRMARRRLGGVGSLSGSTRR